MAQYVLLDGYIVTHVTERAIRIQKRGLAMTTDPIWIPRSLCENPADIDRGDEDISIAQWVADRDGLDYDN